jgi:hypothetical protein
MIDAQGISRSDFHARETPPNAKPLTFFESVELSAWILSEIYKVKARKAHCAEDRQGVVGLHDCYDQYIPMTHC